MYSVSQHNKRMAELKQKDEQKMDGALKFMLMKKDQEEARQHRMDMMNVCPKCFIVRNAARECVMGCDTQY